MKKPETIADNLFVQIYVNTKKDRIAFKKKQDINLNCLQKKQCNY